MYAEKKKTQLFQTKLKKKETIANAINSCTLHTTTNINTYATMKTAMKKIYSKKKKYFEEIEKITEICSKNLNRRTI